MPVMHFNVRWPDGSESRCYSPSLVIRDFFVPGTRYANSEFTAKANEALNIASERVRAKFGFACSAAMDQLAQIESTARRFEPAAEVEVVSFEE